MGRLFRMEGRTAIFYALRKNKYEFNRLFTVVLIRRQFAFVL